VPGEAWTRPRGDADSALQRQSPSAFRGLLARVVFFGGALARVFFFGLFEPFLYRHGFAIPLMGRRRMLDSAPVNASRS
jgi:hypothetical protein